MPSRFIPAAARGSIGQMLLSDLAQARIHIATNLGELDRGKHPLHLQPPARAARGDQLRHFDAAAQDEHIPGVGPRQVTTDRQTRRHVARQILGAMDGNIRLATLKRRLKFAGEQPFATTFFERPLGLPITRRDNLQQLGFDPQLVAQMRRHHLGLGKRERAFAGGENEFRHG